MQWTQYPVHRATGGGDGRRAREQAPAAQPSDKHRDHYAPLPRVCTARPAAAPAAVHRRHPGLTCLRRDYPEAPFHCVAAVSRGS